MKALFAPGCALRAYKPRLVERTYDFLLASGLVEGEYAPCCKEAKDFDEDTALVDCCPGCGHAFETAFERARPVSLWRVLLDTDFPFPDYGGARMTIHDACHARGRNSAEMQSAARALCARMNIALVEPEHTLDATRCCGGSARDYEARRQMALARALDFPEEDVVVYCTGCVRSLSLTPARPRHLLDLLYRETTEGLTVKQ